MMVVNMGQPKKAIYRFSPSIKHWITKPREIHPLTQIDTTYKKIRSWHSQNPLEIWRVWLIVRALGVSLLPDLQVFSHKSSFFVKAWFRSRFFVQLTYVLQGFFVPSTLTNQPTYRSPFNQFLDRHRWSFGGPWRFLYTFSRPWYSN